MFVLTLTLEGPPSSKRYWSYNKGWCPDIRDAELYATEQHVRDRYGIHPQAHGLAVEEVSSG